MASRTCSPTARRSSPTTTLKPILANLQKLQKAGKPVLLIEYPTTANLKKLVTDNASTSWAPSLRTATGTQGSVPEVS